MTRVSAMLRTRIDAGRMLVSAADSASIFLSFPERTPKALQSSAICQETTRTLPDVISSRAVMVVPAAADTIS